MFEETFYNDREQSFSLLCLAGPLDPQQDPDPGRDPGPDRTPYSLRTPEDARNFLGPPTLKLDRLIAAFSLGFKDQEGRGLQHHLVGLTVTRTN